VNDRFGSIDEVFEGFTQYRVNPYAGLALVYDHLMDHVDYAAWADYIVSVFDRYNPDCRDVLETACGTGSLSIELHRRGYRQTCMDISFSMLRRAAEKFGAEGMMPGVAVADMTTLPTVHAFDAVLCLYDSINYLRKPKDLRRAANQAASVLKSGGLFIFDICTVKNSELFFSQHTHVENIDDITCERTCRYNPLKRIQENHFVISFPGEKPVHESHFQKIYLLKEIDTVLKRTPFTVLGRFEDMSFMPGSEESERIHYVLQKR